jgi:hypothetical protein
LILGRGKLEAEPVGSDLGKIRGVNFTLDCILVCVVEVF